ncbi:MAG: hypothetical protein DRN61_06635 [Thaumarchaeota archaeon]|nr:MAG: hypothetical protein DRN61_06635 [Nitrososphaerota archaeon]
MFEDLHYIFDKCGCQADVFSIEFIVPAYTIIGLQIIPWTRYTKFILWIDIYATENNVLVFDSDELGKQSGISYFILDNCPDVFTRFPTGLLNFEINKLKYINFINYTPNDSYVGIGMYAVIVPNDKIKLFKELLINHYNGLIGFKYLKEHIKKAVDLLKSP